MHGRPFIEHRNVPVLAINPRDPRAAWQQVTETLTEAIRSGALAPGDEMPSITELSALQGIGTGVIRHALEGLVADGLIVSAPRPDRDRGRKHQRHATQGSEAARAGP